MRLVHSREELERAFSTAAAEALAAFGDGALYLEKALVPARHVEVQVLADAHGGVLTLGERECSIQRRHQKLVEDSPSPALTEELREEMEAAAERACRLIGYRNAGTFEFLLGGEGDFHFMELNTRLQVEHPVTELVTGLDLVRAQIAVAEGEPLPERFHDVQPHGHAIEVRLYAEDPYRNFTPSPGRIELLRWPEGPGVRNDVGTYEGAEVPIHYDPMLGKLIVWGADRAQALDRLERALGELRIEGVATSVPLFQALLRDEEVRRGELDIAMLDRKIKAGELQLPEVDAAKDLPFVAAALAELEHARTIAGATSTSGARERWSGHARCSTMRSGGWS